ncbi:MAG: Crp/Fnr family transcriptional regulator [Oscillospiraceae bacterium]|nr:Crp/Fnr family transcriptional regulator [Oscillospiraceae bacterium]
MPVVIPSQLVEIMSAKGRKKLYPAKTKIFAQGDVASDFYIVAKGRVRVYTTSADGQERTIEILEAGRIFGDSSFVVNSRRIVTIETVIASEIICIGTQQLISLCATSPQLMELIFVHMAQTCNYLTHQIVQGSHYDSVQKVADFLLTESASRNTDTLPYTHQDIAESVSLNRVTVSRVVSKLRQQGMVEIQYGHIKIADRTKLEKLLPQEY